MQVSKWFDKFWENKNYSKNKTIQWLSKAQTGEYLGKQVGWFKWAPENILKQYLFFKIMSCSVLFTFADRIYALPYSEPQQKVFAWFFAQRCQPYNSHVWFGSRYLHIFCGGFFASANTGKATIDSFLNPGCCMEHCFESNIEKIIFWTCIYL